MESKVKLLGHPIHQMLIVFPLGLLATAVIVDVVYFATDALIFAEVSYYLIAAGLIAGPSRPSGHRGPHKPAVGSRARSPMSLPA